MDITRTSGRRVSGDQQDLAITGRNQVAVRRLLKILATVACGLLLSIPGTARAQYRFITIDVKDATSTSANGNSTNEIVGDFDDATGTHGYVAALRVVEGSVDAHGVVTLDEDKGDFTRFDAPVAGTLVTSINGINASGQLEGSYFDTNTGRLHAFVWNKGAFTTLDPFTPSIRSQGGFINAQGQAVGTFRDGASKPIPEKRRGFIWRKGTFTTFNVPGDIDENPPGAVGFGTVAFGINDIGQVVGNYVAQGEPDRFHGFLRSSTGEFTNPIDFPGTSTIHTICEGINNAGTIAGVYVDDTGLHGFLRSSTGEFTKVDFKDEHGDAHPTEINSINAKGEIVGFYLDDKGAQHGFLGIPVR